MDYKEFWNDTYEHLEKELEHLYEEQKASEYALIKAAGFDSAEVWDLWYESDEDINAFIESLNKLEVDALCRMNEMEGEDV